MLNPFATAFVLALRDRGKQVELLSTLGARQRVSEAPVIRSLPQPMGAGSVWPLRRDSGTDVTRGTDVEAARAKNPRIVRQGSSAARTARPRYEVDAER
jgi:hypothetical protein